MFDDEWLRAAELVVRTWKLEQNHDPDVPPPPSPMATPRVRRGAVLTSRPASGASADVAVQVPHGNAPAGHRGRCRLHRHDLERFVFVVCVVCRVCRVCRSCGYDSVRRLGFRPSDDACKYPFLVPSNMFAVVTLAYLADIAERVYANGALRAEALALRQQIDDGTHPLCATHADTTSSELFVSYQASTSTQS